MKTCFNFFLFIEKVSANGMEEHISTEARSHLKKMEDFYENQLQQKTEQSSQHNSQLISQLQQKTENISQLQQKLNLAEEQLKFYKDKFDALTPTVSQNQPPVPPPKSELGFRFFGGAKPKVASAPKS